jgi:hypothetical protein
MGKAKPYKYRNGGNGGNKKKDNQNSYTGHQ